MNLAISPALLEGISMKVFGLPAHPLIVHAVVVLVPLAALAFVLSALRREWRDIYLFPATMLAAAGAVAAFLAKETGESLEEAVKETGKRLGEHPEQGDTAFIVTVLFGGCAIATYLLFRYGPQLRARLKLEDRLRLPISDVAAAYVVTIPLAIAATAFIVIAGHSGAVLVWKTL